jgi:hypothetical protein
MGDVLDFVSYCGLYCGLCAERARIPQQAGALRKAMAEEGWPSWGSAIPGFEEFWSFLEGLEADGGCPGCRSGGGPPNCQIRVCAQRRELDTCSQCTDFPCSHIEALGAVYPTLVADGRRLQKVGLRQWLAEQRERAQRGVVYADIRCRAGEGDLSQVFGEPE